MGPNPTKGCNLSAQQSQLLAAQLTHPTVTTVGIPTVLERVRWRVGSDPDSGAGPVRVAERYARNPYPIQKEPGRVGNPNPNPDPGPGPGPVPSPSPARHRRRPAAAAASGARARMHGHSSLPIARENSKYPKGTPFVLNFLYLYTTNFHPMANVGLNAFSYL